MTVPNSRQLKYLMSHPAEWAKYQATGRLPRQQELPKSPLIDLISSLPPRLRMEIRGVRLHPKLGYQCAHQFHNAEQLLRWLRPDQPLIGGQSWPAESFRNKRFSKRLTLGDLKPFCASWPSPEMFKFFGVKPLEENNEQSR